MIDFRTQLAEDVLAQIAATLRDAAGVVERIRCTEGFDARYALWGDFGVLLNQVDRLLPEDAAAVRAGEAGPASERARNGDDGRARGSSPRTRPASPSPMPRCGVSRSGC